MSDQILELFRRELKRNRVADSYLLIGTSRLRLRKLASAFSALVLGKSDALGKLESSGEPDTLSSLESLADPGVLADHPDFLLMDPVELGVKGLKVEHITDRHGQKSSLEEALKYKPLRGTRRAVVLLEIDKMTPDAQAAFLKTAEEPPDGTIFFLTATDLSAILPALLSRCRTYRVTPPPAEELLRRATEAEINPEQWMCLLQATGHAEAVLDLSPALRADLLELKTIFDQWLQSPATSPSWLAAPDGSLAEQRETSKLRLSACLGWIRAAYPTSTPEQAKSLDHLVGHVSQALDHIAGQVTPSLVLEQLFQKVQGH